MNQVIGRAAGCQQRHHRVDDTAFIHHPANRCKSFALGDVQHRAHGFTCQLITHGSARVHKGRAGHMQAHGFEQHLVAVGGAVKRAGAGAVVSSRLGLQQLRTTNQALCRLLAHFAFFVVGQARSHGACGHKHRGQMTEVQCANQEAGHDLVANAQHQRGIEHIMAQRHRRGHGDHIA